VKNSADTQTTICIAGAHRSGTSLVTRLLHCCGLELGPESDLMPPQADNRVNTFVPEKIVKLEQLYSDLLA
jgi:hypothetical protein